MTSVTPSGSGTISADDGKLVIMVFACNHIEIWQSISMATYTDQRTIRISLIFLFNCGITFSGFIHLGNSFNANLHVDDTPEIYTMKRRTAKTVHAEGKRKVIIDLHKTRNTRNPRLKAS